MNTINWSDLAYLSYTDISNYLTEKFSLNVAIKFDDKVEKLLKNLETFEELCPKYQRRPSLRKCTIDKHVSLLYRIDGKIIQLVTFFDNRGIHHF
jgi:plasmid stabilization system protein ParE